MPGPLQSRTLQTVPLPPKEFAMSMVMKELNLMDEIRHLKANLLLKTHTLPYVKR